MTDDLSLRAHQMRNLPDEIREPAIRAGVRLGVVVDARDRFMGVPKREGNIHDFHFMEHMRHLLHPKPYTPDDDPKSAA